MKPCIVCKNIYGKYLCNELGNCAFEGTDDWPKLEPAPIDNSVTLVVKTINPVLV
jgi:hypothetical protein